MTPKKLALLASLLLASLLAFATPAAAGDPLNPALPEPSAVQAMELFAGTWEIASVSPDGATKDAKRLVFRRDGTYAAVNAEGKELWAGSYELDPSADPPIFDHRSKEAQQEGRDALGIYDLDGDDLTVACVTGRWAEKKWSGKERPTKFELGDAEVLLKLRRVR